MLNFPLFRSDTNTNPNGQKKPRTQSIKSAERQSWKLITIVLAASLSAGCQPQSSVDDNTVSTEEQAAAEMKPVPQSDSAAAYIKQLQPVYVAQMQSLQRRLQAEYESLQAADMTTSDDN